jgi:hypothetical protein
MLMKAGPSMRQFMIDFLSRELDNYLHKNGQQQMPLKNALSKVNGNVKTWQV